MMKVLGHKIELLTGIADPSGRRSSARPRRQLLSESEQEPGTAVAAARAWGCSGWRREEGCGHQLIPTYVRCGPVQSRAPEGTLGGALPGFFVSLSLRGRRRWVERLLPGCGRGGPLESSSSQVLEEEAAWSPAPVSVHRFPLRKPSGSNRLRGWRGRGLDLRLPVI